MDEIQFRKAQQAAAEGNSKMAMGLLSALGPAVIIAMVGALIALAILVATAGLRGGWILAKALPLYPIVILAAIVVLALAAAMLRRIGFLRWVVGLVAAAAVCFFGWKGATAYYNNSGRVFASVYSADYIQSLPDGSAPKLYEKRNQKGGESALTVDEKVTVNGISFNEQEFNITTADGRTGWVELAAFPKDAAEMLALSIGLDGVDAWEIGIDRETERLMGRFFNIEQKGGGKDPKGYDIVEYKEFTLKPTAMSRLTRVGAQTPILYLTPKAAKKGEQWMDNGTKITLLGVAYEPDCTVVALEVRPVDGDKKTPYYWLPYGGKRNSAVWKSSLTVTDLATGETWQPLPTDYENACTIEGSGKNRKETQLFFFPPFKSRHFSLTHAGVSPLPDGKTKSGYGGIMGWLSSSAMMSGEDSKFYFDWNFPEVNVR